MSSDTEYQMAKARRDMENKMEKFRRRMGKDLRTLGNINEKFKDISKRVSKSSKSSWKRIKPKKAIVELRSMESELGAICRRFELLVSSEETAGVDDLRHKVNLIKELQPKITQLIEVLIPECSTSCSAAVDDTSIGQSSRQFESLDISPIPTPISDDRFHKNNDLRFPRLYPLGEYNESDVITVPSDVHVAEDDNSLAAIFYRNQREMIRRYKSQPPPKFMDGRELCENALAHLKSNEGLDYDFVGFASVLAPTYSTTYGYGIHLNFFARLKDVPSYYAELIFLEVANGSPQRIIRCVPLPEIPYSPGDENKESSFIIYHPDEEDCPFCERAKDGSLSKDFCLP